MNSSQIGLNRKQMIIFWVNSVKLQKFNFDFTDFFTILKFIDISINLISNKKRSFLGNDLSL